MPLQFTIVEGDLVHGTWALEHGRGGSLHMQFSSWQGKIELNMRREVAHIMLIDRSQDSSASRAAGGGLLGGFLLGGVGALTGVLHAGRRSVVTFAAKFHDGRRFVATTGEDTWRILAPLAAMLSLQGTASAAPNITALQAPQGQSASATLTSAPESTPEVRLGQSSLKLLATLAAAKASAGTERQRVKPARVAEIEAILDREQAESDPVSAQRDALGQLSAAELLLYQRLSAGRREIDFRLDVASRDTTDEVGHSDEVFAMYAESRQWADNLIASIPPARVAELTTFMQSRLSEENRLRGGEQALLRTAIYDHRREEQRFSLPERALCGRLRRDNGRILRREYEAREKQDAAEIFVTNSAGEHGAEVRTDGEQPPPSGLPENTPGPSTDVDELELRITQSAARAMSEFCDNPEAARTLVDTMDRDTLVRLHAAFQGASESARIRWLGAAVAGSSDH